MTEQEEEKLARLERHLPSGDVTLVVLKGHLLIEERINEILDKMMFDPHALARANLRLHQKLCLLQACYDVPGMLEAFSAAQTLNTLRNRLAHHLESDDIDRLAAEFIQKLAVTYSADEQEFLKADKLDERLRRCIYLLFGDLGVVLDMTTAKGVVKGLIAAKSQG